MKKFIAVVAIATQVAACSTIGAGLDSVFGSGFSADALNSVRNAAITLCSYTPTLESIAAIWTSATPLVNSIEATAVGICSAVGAIPKSAMVSGALPHLPAGVKITRNPPAINGARVQGAFLK